MKQLWNEFKAFAMKGNVIDLAVGVIIGAAFGKITSSLVNDVFMPLIGLLTGGVDFNNLAFKIGEASVNYGVFLKNVIDFLLIAFVVFWLVKGMGKLARKKEAESPAPPPADVALLSEIRDTLKQIQTQMGEDK